MFSSMTLLKGLHFFYYTTFLMVTAAPKDSKHTPGKSVFPFREYEKYQISDGIAGYADVNATDVWITPFKNMDLASVTDDDLQNIKKMAQTCVDNEKFFIEAVNKAKKDKKPTLVEQLNAGMISNKVLKILGTNQTLTIMKAKGMKDDQYESKFEDLAKKFTKNVATNKKSKGQKMVSYLSVDKSHSSSHSSSSSQHHSSSKTPSGATSTNSDISSKRLRK